MCSSQSELNNMQTNRVWKCVVYFCFHLTVQNKVFVSEKQNKSHVFIKEIVLSWQE